MIRHRVGVACAIAALVAGAGPAIAQSAEADRAGFPRVNLVSTNPIGIIFEWFNGEFEHAIAPTVSLAVAGSHFSLDDANYTSVDGIVRYYPSARAIRGFGVGGSVGFTQVGEDRNCIECRDAADAFTIGVRGDYVWLLGRGQHFAVAAGIGAKRLFYSSRETLGVEALPIGRLSIGYAW